MKRARRRSCWGKPLPSPWKGLGKLRKRNNVKKTALLVFKGFPYSCTWIIAKNNAVATEVKDDCLQMLISMLLISKWKIICWQIKQKYAGWGRRRLRRQRVGLILLKSFISRKPSAYCKFRNIKTLKFNNNVLKWFSGVYYILAKWKPGKNWQKESFLFSTKELVIIIIIVTRCNACRTGIFQLPLLKGNNNTVSIVWVEDIVPQSWSPAKRQTDIEGRERGSAVLGFAGRLERFLNNPPQFQ